MTMWNRWRLKATKAKPRWSRRRESSAKEDVELNGTKN